MGDFTMRKRTWSALIILFLITTLVGCTQKQSTQTTKPKIETTYYQDLSKVDRDRLKFKFKALEDDSTSNEKTSYLVNMTIKNTTNKNIKFNLAKFVMLNKYDTSTKVTANQKKTITVNSGQSKTIDSLFENVAKDILDGQGAYYYLNKNYKLAYFYKSYDNNGVTSANLKSGFSKKFNSQRHVTSANENISDNNQDQTNTTDQSLNSNDYNNQQVTAKNYNNSSQIITTESKAIALFKHMWGLEARDDFAAYPVDGGFFVHSTTEGSEPLDSTILYDGDAIGSDGTVTPYSELSKPLNKAISDGKPFDPSKY